MYVVDYSPSDVGIILPVFTYEVVDKNPIALKSALLGTTDYSM